MLCCIQAHPHCTYMLKPYISCSSCCYHSPLSVSIHAFPYRYAHEVKVEGAGPHSGKGAGLEKALQSKGVRGILNGVEDIVRPSNRELGLGDNSYDKNS